MIDFCKFAKYDPAQAAPLTFRDMDGRVLLTNRAGDFHFLGKTDFASLVEGSLSPDSSTGEALAAKGFLADKLDREAQYRKEEARRHFLQCGPSLHIFVVTLRCNETCVYCHSSRAPMDATHTDMSPETARAALDLVFASTAGDVTMEFQGGEPLLNFDLIKLIVLEAESRNVHIGKRIQFALVSNLAAMDEEKLQFFLEHRVQVCTSLDGPQALHDSQRVLPNDSSFEKTAFWIKRINEAYQSMGLDPVLYHVEALLTTTRQSLSQARAIVDTYRGLGCKALFLRPLDPFGFGLKQQDSLGVTPAEFLAFYREVVDYIIELNLAGEQLIERFAAIFLTKILTGTDPNYLDLRSPCGAGVGQLAYNYDGRIFTCDEGRMLAEMGDEFFLLGQTQLSSYRQLMTHETVCSMLMASNLDVAPDCVHCVYRPYCGTCPVYNYTTQGTLQGRMRDNTLCSIYKGMLDYLFGKIAANDANVMQVLHRWTVSRPRQHFVHDTNDGEVARSISP